jgi:hypothetical protein
MEIVSWLLPVVTLVVVFTFVTVAVWVENRRKERESYYRHETYRKMMETPQGGSREVLDLMRHEELQQRRRLKEGLQLGGLITFVVGVGLGILVYFLIEEEPVWLVGLLPVLVGLVLFVYGAYVLRPLDEPPSGALGESPGEDRRDT